MLIASIGSTSFVFKSWADYTKAHTLFKRSTTLSEWSDRVGHSCISMYSVETFFDEDTDNHSG